MKGVVIVGRPNSVMPSSVSIGYWLSPSSLAPHDHPAVGKADPRHGVRDIQLHHLAHLLAQRCHINLPDDLVVQPVIERQISACFAGEDLQQLFWEKAAILRDAILTD